MEEIINTLKSADNEGTESPYWLIIDPSAVTDFLSWRDGRETIYASLDKENIARIADQIPNCITGPYFSRSDAESHLKARRYAFSKKAYVYCHSGYWSHKYKTFYREIRPHAQQAGEEK